MRTWEVQGPLDDMTVLEGLTILICRWLDSRQCLSGGRCPRGVGARSS